MKIVCKILFIWMLLILPMWAGEANEGKTGLAFLKIGVDARAAGMGEAYTAVANNAYTTYWNPAGLLGADNSNVVFMHSNWLLDVNSEFGALQFNGKKSSLAFHVYTLSVGGIEVRSTPSREPVEETGAQYASVGVSYARNFSSKLDVGVTAKYLYEKILFNSAGGYALDLGFSYAASNKLKVAGTLQNLGSMNEFAQASTKLPTLLRVGAAYQLGQAVGPAELLLAGDVVLPFEENLRMHFGLEAALWQQLILRGGLVNGYESRSFSFGLGIRKSAFHFDYSYSPFNEDLGNAQRFSIYLAI